MKILGRLFFTGLLAIGLSLASTLPEPADSAGPGIKDAPPSAVLPGLMDASSAYADTTSSASISEANTATYQSVGPGLNTVVASGDLASVGSQPEHCMPEPVSVLMMTSGLIGLIAVRRLRK